MSSHTTAAAPVHDPSAGTPASTAGDGAGRLTRWLQDRSVRTRVLSLVGVSVAALCFIGVVAEAQLATAGDRTETLNAANGATRSALLADMMHDAIRSDVLQAQLFADEPARYQEAVDALAEHGGALTEHLDSVA